MSASGRTRRALLISNLDLVKEPNQRTHHMSQMLEAGCDELVIMCKRRSDAGGVGHLIADAMRFSVKTTTEGKVTMHRIHPWFNYAQATAHSLQQADVDDDGSGDRKRQVSILQALRGGLANVLSLLGVVRDMAWLPSMAWAYWRHVRSGFGLCFVDGPWGGLLAWILRRTGQVDFIVYDDMDDVAGGQRLAFRRLYVAMLERAMIRRANLSVCCGWLLARQRRMDTGRDMPVVPNGVDPLRFAAARDRIPHPPTLVYMGHLEAARGVDLAVRAMPILLSTYPLLRLRIIGGGNAAYLGELHAMATQLKIGQSVEFRGAVPYEQLPQLLRDCDVGLATFRLTPQGRHAFPLKVLEYMAAGLPFICTENSSAAELALRTQGGLAVAFTPEALAYAAYQLLSDSARWTRCHDAGLVAAHQFSWENATRSMSELIGRAKTRHLHQSVGDQQ